MKAETEETTCLLDVAGKCLTSLEGPVKGIKDKSSAQEPVIKYGKWKIILLPDEEKGIVHG